MNPAGTRAYFHAGDGCDGGVERVFDTASNTVVDAVSVNGPAGPGPTGSGLYIGPFCPNACNDGNPCTTDSCNQIDGCHHTNNTGPCASDGNPCTDDVCDGAGTCTHPNSPLGASCNDGTFCNGPDTCDGAGGCTNHPGDPCVGGLECNAICNEAADNCYEPIGTPCSTDGDSCTDDVCNATGGCIHPPKTICVNADGRCPAGCTNATDNDCPVPTLTPTPTLTATPTPTVTPTPAGGTGTCADPIVAPGGGGVFAGTTSGTSQVGDVDCYGGSAPEKVYTWTLDVSGWAQVSTCGSSYDTVIFVRDGSCAGADLACNNAGSGYCTGSGSHVIMEVTAGHPYTIVVDGYNSTDHGNFMLTITPAGSDVRRISAKKLLIKDNADHTKRKIIFLSKDVNLDTTGPGTAVDPSTYGADFHVYNANGGNDSACLALPSAGTWAHSGSGYKYKDSQFAHGPCKVAKIKDRSLLKVVCLAKAQPIDYSLDEMTQGAVGVGFTVGPVVYCAELGRTVKKDSGTDPPITGGKGQFAAKDAPAPLTCPTPPSPCP